MPFREDEDYYSNALDSQQESKSMYREGQLSYPGSDVTQAKVIKRGVMHMTHASQVRADRLYTIGAALSLLEASSYERLSYLVRQTMVKPEFVSHPHRVVGMLASVGLDTESLRLYGVWRIAAQIVEAAGTGE